MRTDYSDLFRCKIRLAVADSAFANLRAERNLVRLRPGGWSLLNLACDTHRYASILERTHAVVEQYTTGMYALAASLHNGDAMTTFRSAARAVNGRQLRIIREPPTAAAEAYKEFVLDTVLGRDPCVAQKRLIILRL